MDPWNSAQDILRCTLCQDSAAPMHSEVCNIYLFKECVEKHLSNSPKVHSVVSLKQYLTTLNYPKCRKHPTERCELLCEQCDIPICAKCISSGKHLGHEQIDIFQNFEDQKIFLQKQLQELEKSIYPEYQEIVSVIPVQKADLSKISQKLTTAIDEQGGIWHREIDTIIQKLKSNVGEEDSKQQVILNKQEDEITHTISEITQSIAELKKLLNSNDVSRVFEYKSRISEFRRLPHKLKVSLPNFKPRVIHTDKLMKQFGSLSAVSFATEDDYIMPTFEAESSPPDRSLMVVPRVITAIDTGYEELCGVSCLSDTEMWTHGDDNKMRLFNVQGDLVKSVQTKSGNVPYDTSVTRSGNLVYTDDLERTVNIVKNKMIETVIRLQWSPLGVCCTSSGDLLVIESNGKSVKVVRYSGFTEIQSIQYDDKRKPIYSSGGYITENRNLDICVSDREAGAVVVVNQAGKLRFTFFGPLGNKRKFDPRSITTDSQGRILTADGVSHRIYILHQDGRPLYYIGKYHLQEPLGLCVDTRDNLFVADWDTGFCEGNCHPSAPTYPHARCLHSCSVVDANRLVIYGGCLSGGETGGPCPSGDSWIFRNSEQEWTRLPDCASPRIYSSMALLPEVNGQKRIVLYGGIEKNRQVIQTTESPADTVVVLDPDSMTWTTRIKTASGSFPAKRASAAMAPSSSGLYLFGGINTETNALQNDIWFLAGNSTSADQAAAGECVPIFTNFLLVHGLLMFFGWGVCLVWGTFIARYFSSSGTKWFLLHRIFQVSGLILSFLGFVLGIVSVQFDHFKFAHGAIGIIVMLLGISQPFNALARPHRPSEGEKTPLKRRIWELFHHNIGRVAVALVLINISLGVFLALAHTAVWALWFVYLIVVILVFVFFELLKIQVVHEKLAAILPLKTKEYPVSNEQKMENVAKADDSQQEEK